ncbi:MAG TPA: hypothetical protein VHD62_00835 [Opitutaceae bacterium]|nr:hypothetical protein [Opitutaceae bacterium]HVT55562.1 hypothetical protein [Xanthobacteraceae bacterium]
MIRSLRIYFLGLALREKLLVVAILAIGVMIWASNFSDRTGRFWRAQRTTTAALKEQDVYLNNQAKIEAGAKTAAARLVPSETLNATRLFTTIQQIANECGLNSNLREEQPTQVMSNGQLTVNAMRFTISNADWPALEKFYLALNQRSPYIALKSAQLVPNRANPAQQLTFIATVSAVEILP